MKSYTYLFAALFALFIVFISASGCFKRGADREAKVSSCALHNNQEGLCAAALRLDGKRCKFDKLTGSCTAESDVPGKPCEKMSMVECRASAFCTYQDANNSCGKADPALIGKCEVIQSEAGCKAHIKCQWNAKAIVCEDKK